MPEKRYLELFEVREKLHQLYEREGNWRLVAELLGLTKGTVYRIAVHGDEPKDDHIREVLDMGPVCDKCGRAPKRKYKPRHTIQTMSVEALRWALENRKEI